MLDFYFKHYDNKFVHGDFNLKPNDPLKMAFLNEQDLSNLIKNNTCFKEKGSCIDLSSTNQNYSLAICTYFKTGLRDHHHLIYSMLRPTVHKEEPMVIYSDYKTFS